MKDLTRRDFLKIGTLGLVGAVVMNRALPIPGEKEVLAAGKNGASSYWRFIVDTRKCIGCGKCVKACKLENDVPLLPETNRTWVERYIITGDEQVLVDSPNGGIEGFGTDSARFAGLNIQKSFFVPKLCNQCDKPPCVSVCPVAATYRTREGVVLVDRKACIGCRYCIQACPYGARFFDPRLKIVDKCTWCYHRVTRGLMPACVEVCPVGARMFGDIRDTDCAVSRAIREETLGILKPELGNQNKVYYIGLEKGVR